MAFAQDKEFFFDIDSVQYMVKHYTIYSKANDAWEEIKSFSIPTFSMLRHYRSEVQNHFSIDTSRYKLSDIISDISSPVSAATFYKGKIWVGFSYYEGEGTEGIGGIGFFDIKTKQIGVLRHPALINQSVKALYITDDTIYVQSICNYELTSTVGNGLVCIDRRTLNAIARIPPTTLVLWDKDSDESCAEFYEKPIQNIISDKRFIYKIIPQWSKSEFDKIKLIGSEKYMQQVALWESELRKKAIISSKLIYERSIVFSDSGNAQLQEFNNDDFYVSYTCTDSFRCGVRKYSGFLITSMISDTKWEVLIKPIDGVPCDGSYHPIHVMTQNKMSWQTENWNKLLKISITDFKTKKIKYDYITRQETYQYFTKMSFKIALYELGL